MDSSSSAADKGADEAALDFASYFQTADARRCSNRDPWLDGIVSNRLWDTYSCHKVMTPADVAAHCHYGAGAGGGGKGAKVTVLSHHPLTERLGPINWGSADICPGQKTKDVGGSYTVTVRKGPAGWYAIAYTSSSRRR